MIINKEHAIRPSIEYASSTTAQLNKMEKLRNKRKCCTYKFERDNKKIFFDKNIILAASWVQII